MRTKRAFTACVVGAFVVLSALLYRGAPQRIVTGVVREFEAGQWIAVANDQTDPRGYRITLRETTAYEGNPSDLVTGARVTVTWRSVGERRFVADNVHVFPAVPTR
jgi:hypothetical protein